MRADAAFIISAVFFLTEVGFSLARSSASPRAKQTGSSDHNDALVETTKHEFDKSQPPGALKDETEEQKEASTPSDDTAIDKLKAAQAELTVAKGRSEKIHAVRIVQAAIKAIPEGAKSENKALIAQAEQEVRMQARKYKFDHGNLPSDGELEIEERALQDDARDKLKVAAKASKPDFEELTAAVQAGKDAGLSTEELQEADTKLKALIKQREKLDKKIDQNGEIDLTDAEKNAAVVPQLSAWLLSAVFVFVCFQTL